MASSGYTLLRRESLEPEDEKNHQFVRSTLVAGLSNDIPSAFEKGTVYTSPNKTAADLAWSEIGSSIHEGVIVLPDSDVQRYGLPRAQRWPWDHSKGIYLVNGYHQLHCVHAARITLHSLYTNTAPYYPRPHIDHCLDTLREEAICQADDTPRYTGRLNAQAGVQSPTSGIGQQRKCRDWGKLESWVRENSACYLRDWAEDEEAVEKAGVEERYKYCPGGEVYWNEDEG